MVVPNAEKEEISEKTQTSKGHAWMAYHLGMSTVGSCDPEGQAWFPKFSRAPVAVAN